MTQIEKTVLDYLRDSGVPQLLEACEEARKAIDSLPIESLGEGHYTESNGFEVAYPIRDELLDNLNKAIKTAKELPLEKQAEEIVDLVQKEMKEEWEARNDRDV